MELWMACVAYYVAYVFLGLIAMIGSDYSSRIEMIVIIAVALVGPILQPIVFIIAFPYLYFNSLRAYVNNKYSPPPPPGTGPVSLSLVD